MNRVNLHWHRVLRPFQEFFQLEASSGILLLTCTFIALLWANSPFAKFYFDLWSRHITLGIGAFAISKDLLHWINDGLMVIFFFVVGLEIKREIRVGELASRQQAAPPIAAALGGMITPALIYLLINSGTSAARGWGIPMATDLAFAIGALSLLGNRVPTALKVFLTALAIVDDLGAVLVIALFYTEAIAWEMLALAAVIFIVLMIANRLDVQKTLAYVILGVGLWLALLNSGIHATIAGILLALTVPFGASREGARDQAKTLLERLEHTLHPWVAFLILPVFALANAGVALGGEVFFALTQPIALGVFLGLVVGKQIGVTTFTWLCVKMGLGILPAGANWKHIYGVGWLAGIGFTMSLFIASLAFGAGPQLSFSKLGTLSASLIDGMVGWFLLRRMKF